MRPAALALSLARSRRLLPVSAPLQRFEFSVRAKMKQKISQTLFAYWNEVRQDRAAPRRFEIEPSQIAGILPHTFILERVDSETFRYRLAGTGLCEAFRQELRDTNFLAGFTGDDRADVERLLSSVTLQCGAGVLEFEAKGSEAHSLIFEVILLPLVHTRDCVDRVLGAIAPVTVPEWLGTETLSDWRLMSNDVIWPTGRPQPPSGSPHRQLPFQPHIRKARIVRSERRQFRVYDGGLSKATDE